MYIWQSSNDVVNWLFYKEACKAEDYTVLAGRLSHLLPDIRRIYKTKELCPDGQPSGVYVQLVLVADKPFIRHVCGLLSHNADSFGAPFCDCGDTCEEEMICEECTNESDERPSRLYDFTMDKRNHCGTTSFEDLCHRAHVAPWEALGEREPAKWRFVCPCCHEVSRA